MDARSSVPVPAPTDVQSAGHDDEHLDDAILDETDSEGDSTCEIDPVIDLLNMEDSVDMEDRATEDQAAAVPLDETPIIPLVEVTNKTLHSPTQESHATAVLSPRSPSLPPSIESGTSKSKAIISSFRPIFAKAGKAPSDFTSPPPSPPPAYGSMLFPSLHPFNACPAIELSAISHNYLAREKAAFKGTRLEGEFAKLYDSKENGRPFCKTCSEFGIEPSPTWHRHYSSKILRMESELDNWGRYSCSQCCNSPHYAITGARTRVLLTSSTLDDYWGKKIHLNYEGDSLHIDCICIPGGRISDLTKAFQAEFSTHPLPIDAVCIVGYNDILSNPCFSYCPEDELEELLEFVRGDVEVASWQLNKDAKKLKSVVLSASPPHEFNSIAYSTLPVPPCLAWKNHNNTPLARAENINNGLKIEMLNELNKNYRTINAEVQSITSIETTRAPSFKAWGLKRRASHNGIQHEQRPDLALHDNAMGPFSSRLNQFREKNPKHKLHFSGAQKLKMGKACIRYFKALYGLEEANAVS